MNVDQRHNKRFVSLRSALSRRSLLQTSAGLGLLAGHGALAQPKVKQPNIIFIIADDLGVYDLGCYGQTKIRTPNIDSLAAEGMRFTAAYGGAPICSPSRCSLMTGQHSGHATIRDNFALAAGRVGHKGDHVVRRANLRPGEKTVATYLQAAGYTTGLVGKWHLDGYSPDAVPTEHGFEEFHGWLTQTETTQGYFPTQWYEGTQLHDIPENTSGRQVVYETDLVTDQACDFIRRHKAETFFLTVAYNAPHSPYVATTEGRYAGESWGKSEKSYASLIEFLDDGVGSILRTLKEQGLDGETVLFFSSDHGPRSEPTAEQNEVVRFFDSHGDLRGYKRDLYEGGIRVPLIVRWPGHIDPHSTNATPIYHPDFLPTAVSLAGGTVNDPHDGSNYASLLLNSGNLPSRTLYWETFEPSFWQAARRDSWKAVKPTNDAQLELYDLQKDPSEQNNVAAAHPQKVAEFSQFLKSAHVPSAEYPNRL